MNDGVQVRGLQELTNHSVEKVMMACPAMIWNDNQSMITSPHKPAKACCCLLLFFFCFFFLGGGAGSKSWLVHDVSFPLLFITPTQYFLWCLLSGLYSEST